ncbi:MULTISPECIES: acetoacetate--CoA ligase [Hydrocarboniphaga]|uniref:Acetoacetyl-CoA synthetase n=1 Tax=Hydrocarboniphaga effusa AP103 TaxID=1172194 RepID=I8T9Z0_9GAMM|nr:MULTISPECIES: acetoacetate--CoA ligase [Hydrocarboniphaga]EIT70678.1 acetoacetyl-CoA synthetase [Hydrocarboniphaga effusa AP103]MDZ4081193.1 acetoacetate--CoA ligase [Hydrocarboniphaga sp.]
MTQTMEAGGVREGELLWTPRPEYAAASNVAKFVDWLRSEKGVELADYNELHRWSVSDIEGFWSSIWAYFDVQSDTPYTSVIDRKVMPGARWFDGSRVNYAEHLLRHEGDGRKTAFHHLSETRELAQMSWGELGDKVRIVATQLRALGIRPGDRIVSYMPNVPETAIAAMATIAIGAVWSSAAPEFGVKTVIERFSQIEPKLLFVADGYRFAGKDFSREQETQEIVSRLPTLEHVVWLPYLNPEAKSPVKARPWSELLDHPAVPRESFRFERVPCDHPIWVVFSSGTTGLPKAIVHSHVGVLLEHLKLMHFHINLKPGSVMFFYTTTGWMMWNLLLAALLTGASAVLYDGSPMHPGPDFLWQLAARTRCTSFGASPTFVQMMEKAGLRPGESHDLSALEGVLVSGSPSTPETFAWFYRHVKQDLWVTSQSGGTEICSGFVGAAPTLPVYAGEIQTRMLGMDVRALSDDGKEVIDEVGELCVKSPFPSMPIYFLKDEGGKRYQESYFEVFPGIWRHGDFIKINSRGGCYIYGRSDSTLNRFGVRIGTAEIYRCVEQLPEIADSLVVCVELPGGKFFMPMFVKLNPGSQLDGKLESEIARRLRNDCSPRHVPDRVYAVEAIPYTLTGKKMEVPVRKLLVGMPLEKAASRDAMMNPAAIDWYVKFAQESADYSWRVA